MNDLHQEPGASLQQVAPILDEAIIQLGSEDRTAILLRFFEQRDFRSVGEALGSNEDAPDARRLERWRNYMHVAETSWRQPVSYGVRDRIER